MKKLFFLALFACAACSLQAQVYVGGSLGAWTDKQDNVKVTSWKIAPEVGYAFNDKWNAGVVLGYGDTAAYGEHLQFTPYVDYTFYRHDIASMFVEAGASYIARLGNKGGSSNDNRYEFGLKPGLAVRLSDKFSMRAHLGFLGYRHNGANSDSYGLTLDAEALAFGFHYSF